MTRLDIFADPVCPWCLIGKVELDRALASRPNNPFEITWHPFRLNPTMPREGMDRAAYLQAKFGDRTEAATRSWTERATALGLVLNVSDREPDTTDAHRLMHWAGLEGAQDKVMSGLLNAYWSEAQDIGLTDVLIRLAKDAGMDPDVTARLLASDADRDEVATRETHARQRGISSVPTFVVGDTHAVSGAQPAQLWQQVIDEIVPTPQ